MVEGGVAGEVGAEDGGAGFDAGPEDHGYYCRCVKSLLVRVWVSVGARGRCGGGCVLRKEVVMGDLQPKFAPKLVLTLTSTRITV